MRAVFCRQSRGPDVFACRQRPALEIQRQTFLYQLALTVDALCGHALDAPCHRAQALSPRWRDTSSSPAAAAGEKTVGDEVFWLELFGTRKRPRD